ncbi:MAG: helix-turn-helix domain-containing protein [Nanoarchaeota archaeon]|nr:helix-turn-helix domain-containing protein [Nanoarchaeota archaeon]
MNLSELRNIGLTEGELKIYGALLEHGEATRQELTKRSGISSSKIYEVANHLAAKGLISMVKKNDVLHFSAANPGRLESFLQKKEEELSKERDIVKNLLPTLQMRYLDASEEANVEVFYGWEGMETAFDDLANALGPKDKSEVFGASKGYDNQQADIFFSRFYQKKRKKGFATKIIFNEDMRGSPRIDLFKQAPNQCRFLHQDTYTEINTYKKVVLFVMLLKKPIVIRITSEEAANSFRTYFESLWKQASAK